MSEGCSGRGKESGRWRETTVRLQPIAIDDLSEPSTPATCFSFLDSCFSLKTEECDDETHSLASLNTMGTSAILGCGLNS